MNFSKGYILIVILGVLIVCTGCTVRDEKGSPEADFTEKNSSSSTLPVTTTPIQTASPPQPIVTSANTPPLNQGSLPKNILDVNKAYIPSGYMGDWPAISMIPYSKYNPHSSPDCIKCSYNPLLLSEKGWAGVYWLSPYDNWGDKENGRDLSKYHKLTFWARGETGQEKVMFCVGGINGTKFHDSIRKPLCSKELPLTTEWVQYEIDLSNQNLSHIIGGFNWVTSNQSNPRGCSFYLDDIFYE